MAITVDELAFLVDSALSICLIDEVGNLSLEISGLQIQVGAGPALQAVVGLGTTPNECRDSYATNISNQIAVIGGNPRGFSVRVPPSIIGFEPTGETGP